MSFNQPEIEQIQKAVDRSLHRHWLLGLVEGLILIILGVAAVVVPRTVAVEFLFGWLFFFIGITGIISTLWVRHGPGFGWSLLSGILAVVAGLLILLSPNGVLSLTLILIVFFVIEGIASIMYALEHKRSMHGQWGWMLISGIVDICLAAVILIGLPASAAWAPGLLVGINLFFGGMALAAMALHARKQSSLSPAP